MRRSQLMTGAVILDACLGEPRRWHPLNGFGWIAGQVKRFAYGPPALSPARRRLRGALAVTSLILPTALLARRLVRPPLPAALIEVLVLYLGLGQRSLHEHARAVSTALAAGDEAQARYHASLLVSRDPQALEIIPATLESVLENGNDAVFGALCWFALAGAPGVIVYRLANTLDACWGYRNARYRDFGWAAARLDDVLNYLPARLTALTYAHLGKPLLALECWWRQAGAWESPNAGPVMAAGAGALAVRLGGPARYAGQWRARPPLGDGTAPQVQDLERGLRLIRRGVAAWLAVIAAWEARYA